MFMSKKRFEFPVLGSLRAKHDQIYAYLQKEILGGQFRQGTRLPPELEIAEHLNVSRGTVRRAFERLVDEGLCRRRRGEGTFVSAGSHGPRANAAGTPTIAVLVDVSGSHQITHPFFEEAMRGMAEELGDHGKLQFTLVDEQHVNGTLAKEIKIARGIVLLGNHRAPLLERFTRLDKPVVSVEFRYRQFPISSVVVDNRSAGYLVGRHLIELGCRNVFYFTTGMSEPEFMERGAGVLEALREVGLAASPAHLVGLGGKTTGLAARKLFSLMQQHAVDGLIGCKDIVALELLRALKDRTKRAHKVRVAGFDDLYASALASPPLTTIHQPPYQLGRKAIRMVNSFPHHQPQHVELQASLVIRDSTLHGV